MQDTKLFEPILRITTPLHAVRAGLKTVDKRVDLWLEHEATRWSCPECGELLPGFDHAKAHPATSRPIAPEPRRSPIQNTLVVG
jgi:hypothetical protein